jgi:DNA segregation ATPase FtsK/SpoIIIE-like protein
VAQGKPVDRKPLRRSETNSSAAASKSDTSNEKSSENPKSESDDQFVISPDFWDSVLDSIPPWGDEIAAIMLIVFGLLSFLSLLNISSDATLSSAWSNTLTSLFGYGSVVVVAGILLLGVIILLPKVGIVIKFPARRILALEIAFLSLLAVLHLVSGDSEWRALARAGKGGGLIGGVVSSLVREPFGSVTALMFFAIAFFICLLVIAGVRRSHLSGWLQQTSERLRTYGDQMAAANAERRREKRASGRPSARATTTSAPASTTLEDPIAVLQTRRTTVLRIRPNPENLPPSQRVPSTAPESARPGVKPVSSPMALSLDGKSVEPGIADGEKSDDKIIDIEFNAVGKLLGKKSKDGVQMVERPDGRIKRFFTVAAMKEPKRATKREKDLPPLTIFQDVDLSIPDEDEINRNVVLIENTLLEFDINIDVVDVKFGPTVTQYAVQPFRETTNEEGEPVLQRTRLSRIAALSSDLALALSAKRLRLETPVPGHSYMGVEVPNKNPSIVALRSVYESRYYQEQERKNTSPLFVPLGRDVSGSPVGIDLASLPHLLIAGTTGSGKSVCIAALATAVILNNTPDRVKMVMLDPKMVELSRFNGLPHLIGPVETDMERIIGVLRWCTREMDRRYKVLEENAARNIDIFNSRLGRRRQDEYMPYIVIMVDEIGDLMMNRPEETEKTLTRLAQMARATGMHLVVATQRPSVDVITGLIKANFPSRIAFAVPSNVDSRVILDTGGADTLLGKGDMLYLASDASGPRRLQGCFVSDDEVRGVVKYWKEWEERQVKSGKMPSQDAIAPWERGLTRREFLSETDPMLEDAIELVVKEGEASASLIQRRLGLGYPRAARIIDLMEELGVIGEPVAGGRTRKVLIPPGEDPFKKIIEQRTKNK